MSDDLTTDERLALLQQQLRQAQLRAEAADNLIKAVQAELLAGGSLARLRALTGLTQED